MTNERQTGEPTMLPGRIATALLQAAALYLLTGATIKPLSWPATDPRLFVPLLLVSAYVPLIILLGLGKIRGRSLAIWAVIATAFIAGLGLHDVMRGDVAAGVAGMPWPSAQLWFTLSAALFVAHILVVDSITERRLIPPYARHFDTAWKQGMQAVLTLAFVGVFWGVLHLGAGLFKLIGIDVFRQLIGERWFIYPATTLALAVAVHATDVQPSLIRGVRSVALTLFTWLLPLLAVILLGFLGSLPFISLAPLWNTRFATPLLLVSAGLLVFLINSCYQDGAAEQTTSRLKRLAATVAAIELVPLVGLAIWGLSLRVGQYGWTVDRIMAASAIAVLACYALGYASATMRAPVWLKRIEITNFVAAYVFLALVVALFSPIADPARLMVASQVSRLESGAVSPAEFDFSALKFDGAKWGAAALAGFDKATGTADAATIRARAAQAIASRYPGDDRNKPRATASELAARIEVHPPGRTLPAAFYETGLGQDDTMPYCLRTKAIKCAAQIITLRPGGPEAVLLFDSGFGYLFEQDAPGKWRKTATLGGSIHCGPVRQAMARGEFRLESHGWPDIVVGNQRLTISPLSPPCPAEHAGAPDAKPAP